MKYEINTNNRLSKQGVLFVHRKPNQIYSLQRSLNFTPIVSDFKQFSPFNLWKGQNHICGTVKGTFLQFLYLFSSKMIIFESLQNNIWHSKGHSMVKFWLLATKTKRKKDIQRLKWSKTEVEALWLRKMTYESLLTSDL